jgi:hypothetical protein
MGRPGDDGMDGDQAFPIPFVQIFPFTPSGLASSPGLVPDPGATAGTTRFLREDATWTTPTATVAFSFSGETPPTLIQGANVVNDVLFDGGIP